MPKIVGAAEAASVMFAAGFEPMAPYVNSRTPWESIHVKCGAIVYPTYGAIKSGRRGCRNCSDRKLRPEYAIEIMRGAGLEPQVPFVSTITKWKSLHLRCGKIVYPKFASIQDGHSGCITCSTEDRKEATRLHQPNLYTQEEANRIAEDAQLIPLEPYLNIKTRWKCRCLICSNIVFPKLGLLQSRGQRSCATCRKTTPYKGKFSESEAIDILLMANRQALEPYKDTKTSWKSKCLVCGSIGSPTLSNIKKRGNSCATCGASRTQDAKKMTQEQAERIYLEGGMKLLEKYPHENAKPLECQCLKCKRIVRRPLASVKRSKNGCEYCAGTMVDPDEATQFMIEKGYKPEVPYPGTDTPWKVTHIACGTPCKPTYGTIRRTGNGCRKCANYGWDNSRESYIYLITHKDLGAHKIGIANTSKVLKIDRLHRHQTQGWEAYKKWEFSTGQGVLEVEAEVFRILRIERKIPVFLSKEQMKYGGWTETVDADLISLPEISTIISKAIGRLTKLKLT